MFGGLIMSFAAKYNTPTFLIRENKNLPFRTLKELINENNEKMVYRVNLIYFNHKTNYDPHPVVVSDDYSINLPPSLMEVCKRIVSDYEAVDAINKGLVGIKITSYTNSYGVQYTATWVDLRP